MAEANLQELFVLLEKGDRDAFSRIYQQLKQPVYTICYRIVQSRETAEDITHDVFVKLFRCPPDASVQNIRAWIFQMARNLSVDALRKNARTVEENCPGYAGDGWEPIHLRMDVEAALSRLPGLEREILTLHLNAELSFKEISQITGLSLAAVYRKYRKALKALQMELNGG